MVATSCLYEGYWKDNKPHGRGRLILPDLNVVEGTFIDGLIVSQWTDKGKKYEGNCNFDGQAHGKCKVKNKNGDYFDGDW